MLSEAVSRNGGAPLVVDENVFQEKFPNLGFKVAHDFADRPEFDLGRLVELSQRIPAHEVEYFSGEVGVDQDPHSHPKNGLSIAETVRRIEECRSWMVLKNVQADPEYANLMREFLSEVYRRAGSSMRGMHREEAFIFISSPNSVTPYHLDEEHNFLLQIRGSKEVSLWDPRDRVILPEEQSEHMLQIWHDASYHRSMPFQPEFQERATVFPLSPGEGLHFPVGAPHWVKNGPAVSVSFSVTFRSEMSRRQAVIYFVNGKLRRLGIKPSPLGQSHWRDSFKYSTFQAGRQIGNVLAGSWLKRKQNKWA